MRKVGPLISTIAVGQRELFSNLLERYRESMTEEHASASELFDQAVVWESHLDGLHRSLVDSVLSVTLLRRLNKALDTDMAKAAGLQEEMKEKLKELRDNENSLNNLRTVLFDSVSLCLFCFLGCFRKGKDRPSY